MIFLKLLKLRWGKLFILLTLLLLCLESFSQFGWGLAKSPTIHDSTFIEQHQEFLSNEFSIESIDHYSYSRMGISLWNLNRLNDAKKIFTKIIASNHFEIGDKIDAHLFLAKIYAEQDNNNLALKSISYVEKKSSSINACGFYHLGVNQQLDELKELISNKEKDH